VHESDSFTYRVVVHFDFEPTEEEEPEQQLKAEHDKRYPANVYVVQGSHS
jgi:hypothetical protein